MPRSVGAAVERNRMKRRLRVIWRGLAPNLGPVDCVVVVYPEAAELSFQALSERVSAGLTKALARRP